MGSSVAVQQRQRLFREGLSQLLGVEEDIEVVGVASTAEELVGVCEERCPDVVLLEADATEWDAGRLAAAVRRLHPRCRVVALTAGAATVTDVARARRGGMGLVSRSGGISGILAAVRAAGSGARSMNVASLSGSVPAPPAPPAALTARELTILNLVGAGCTSREISKRLAISHKTVENHKQRIFAKLGVQNQAHAVSVAMRSGLMRPERVIDLAAAD